MADLTAKRTLVKSPPELWEELSEVERLAKHLGAFGEIRITKLEPEHTVAWEGEHASGTVSIEPSGWGTKVTLTAELAQPVAPPVAEVPIPQPEPEPPPAPEPAPEPDPDPEPVAEEPPAAAASRRGFWSRLLGRRGQRPDAVEEPARQVAVEAPDPEAEPEPPAAPVASLGPTTPAAAARPPARPEPERDAMPEADARAVLDEVLETLGTAHHRPFSRP